MNMNEDVYKDVERCLGMFEYMNVCVWVWLSVYNYMWS